MISTMYEIRNEPRKNLENRRWGRRLGLHTSLIMDRRFIVRQLKRRIGIGIYEAM